MAALGTLYFCADHIPHEQLVEQLDRIERRLARIERAIRIEGATLSEIDDRLTQVSAALADLSDDITRELADLQAALAGNLSAEQQAAFDNVLAKVAAIKTAVDTVDPAPPAA